MKTVILEGTNNVLLIGESAIENWNIIDTSEPNWWWFHLKSFPSSHVVLKSDIICEKDIRSAAQYCKHSTKYRFLKDIKISYCQIKNIKKSTKIGSVTYISKRKVSDIKV
tara:strand:+ start:237 stop:566 length:330 start_codon:yes stop_codon:yes gene_type:complete